MLLHTLKPSSQAESCTDLWGRNLQHQNKSEPQKLIKRLFSSWHGKHHRTGFRRHRLSLSLFSPCRVFCNLFLALPLPMFCFPDFCLELSTFEQSRTSTAGSQNNSNGHMRASAWTGPAHDPEWDCNSDTMTSWSTGEKACSEAKQSTYSTKQHLLRVYYLKIAWNALNLEDNWHIGCLILLFLISLLMIDGIYGII